MDSKSTVTRRSIMGLLFGELATSRPILSCLITLLSAGGLLLAGCQPDSSTDSPEAAATPDTVTPAEPPSPAATPTPQADAAEPTSPQPPTLEPEPELPAPANTAAVQSGATLPNALTRQWEPASNVLFTFGPMTITPEQVEWGSGQRSAYRVVSTDGGYLLQLESSPSFYETPNPYIKLIPKTDEAGGTTSMDVAFFESDTKANSDEYIMYGSYFVE